MRAFPALPPVRTAAVTGGSSWSLGSLSNLVQRFLDANPTYHAQAINSYPIITPEETGTVAQPRAGRCWLFDGTDDYGFAQGRITAGTVSVLSGSAWVKITGTSAEQVIMGEWRPGVGLRVFKFSIATGGALQFWGSPDSTAEWNYSTSATIPTGTWTHVGFIYNAGVVTLFINGVVVSATLSGSVSSTLFNANSASGINFGIGCERAGGSPASYFGGSMYGVRVYSVAKSAGEIAAIYNQSSTPNTIDTTGLLAHYACSEESGTTGYDCSGNAKHLTLTNITQATFHVADTGVKWSLPNQKGYTLSGSVVIPASLSTPTQDAAGGAIGVTGPVAYPATVDVPCVTGDGSAVYCDLGSALIPATADFSLSLRYYHVTNDTNRRTVISQRDSGATGRLNVVANDSAGTGSAGAMRLFISSTGTIDFSLTGALTAATWHVITLTRAGSLFTLSCVPQNGSAVTGSGSATVSVYQSQNTRLFYTDAAAPLNGDGRISDLRITTGGVTTYFPLQDGPGSSNTNRDLAYCKSDGTGGVVSGAIVNGTVSTIWANRCSYAQDWAIQYGGSYNPNRLTSSSVFDNADWNGTNATRTANQATSPTGSMTADEINFTANSGLVYRNARVPVSANTTYTMSIWLRSSSGTFKLKLASTDGVSWANQSAVSAELTLTTSWQRFSLTFTTGPGWTQADFVFGSEAKTPYNMPATGTVYASDAQLELGSIATPYQGVGVTVNGAFIPGRIGSANDAAGNAKTLAAGKCGNPHSRLNRNRWAAPELVNIGIAANDALAPSDAVQATSPADTKFRRSKADGSDRYFATSAALTGTDKTNAEGYVG